MNTYLKNSDKFSSSSRVRRLIPRRYGTPYTAIIPVIASNTLNSRADDIEAKVGIPVLRIYDVTGAKVNKSGLKKVALLGTKFTMEQPFYRDVLKNKYGIEVVTPNATERD